MSDSEGGKERIGFSIHLIWPIVVIAMLLVFKGIWGDSSEGIGEKLYLNTCASCHGQKGEGYGELIPPLAKADFLQKNSSQLPCIILYGLKGEISVNGKTYDQPMAGLGLDELGQPKLSVSQIQQLINYIQSNWGNTGEAVNRQQVADWLKKCKPEK